MEAVKRAEARNWVTTWGDDSFPESHLYKGATIICDLLAEVSQLEEENAIRKAAITNSHLRNCEITGRPEDGYLFNVTTGEFHLDRMAILPLEVLAERIDAAKAEGRREAAEACVKIMNQRILAKDPYGSSIAAITEKYLTKEARDE